MTFWTQTVLIYLALISLTSASLFVYDKISAKRNGRRIPERTLHVLEFLGGFFINIILMYSIHHKNRKFSYWIWTWLILIVWAVLLFLYLKPQ